MPRSEKQRPSRLKAATFCIGIYLCSFLVVNHYINKDHPMSRTSDSSNRPAFGPHSLEEAHIWYNNYCRRQVQGQMVLAQTLRKKLHADPSNAKMHFQYAEVLNEELGRKDQALVQYRQAVGLKPKSVLYHLTFGAMLQQHGMEKEALTQYQSAANCTSHPLSAQYEVGCILCREGRQQEGIAVLTKITNSSDQYWSFAAATHLRSLTQTSLHI